jgi:hypothetical protein
MLALFYLLYLVTTIQMTKLRREEGLKTDNKLRREEGLKTDNSHFLLNKMSWLFQSSNESCLVNSGFDETAIKWKLPNTSSMALETIGVRGQNRLIHGIYKLLHAFLGLLE